jgi:NAD(P)-dependent dehydrogenase (short-subunit alcohol dehydrogenase family)
MEPKTHLKGTVAVITGGASGIGLALALRAADEGMQVALADVDERMLDAALEQVRAKDVAAIAVRTDVSDSAAVRTLAGRTEAELGPPWLVCNSSGVSPFGVGRCHTPASLKSVINENLWGVIHGVQCFAPGMVERGAGHIVNIAFGDLFGIPGAAPYVATMHAIVGLSESLYRELDVMGSQVGVTVVCPAPVNASVTSATHNPSGPRNVQPPAELVERIFTAVTTRRFWLFTQFSRGTESYHGLHRTPARHALCAPRTARQCKSGSSPGV